MKYKKRNVRWMLVVYDLLVYELSAVLLLGLYGGNDKLSISGMMQQMVLALLCVFSIRLIGNVYGQIWRYGGIQCYIRLLYTDAIAFFVYLILELILPVEKITFARMLCLISINLLGALALMEHNCIEAIYNNVFGTQNLVELCEKYEAERFMMVSTDKAVNPTNVMGATKRM